MSWYVDIALGVMFFAVGFALRRKGQASKLTFVLFMAAAVLFWVAAAISLFRG